MTPRMAERAVWGDGCARHGGAARDPVWCRLTDALALRSGADLTDDTPADRGKLVRLVEVLDGTVRLRVERGAPRRWPRARGVAGAGDPGRAGRPVHLRSAVRWTACTAGTT